MVGKGGNKCERDPFRTHPVRARGVSTGRRERQSDRGKLRPLAESVDPEALDALFDGRAAENAYVTFRHEGFTITVTGNEDVLVDPVDAE